MASFIHGFLRRRTNGEVAQATREKGDQQEDSIDQLTVHSTNGGGVLSPIVGANQDNKSNDSSSAKNIASIIDKDGEGSATVNEKVSALQQGQGKKRTIDFDWSDSSDSECENVQPIHTKKPRQPKTPKKLKKNMSVSPQSLSSPPARKDSTNPVVTPSPNVAAAPTAAVHKENNHESSSSERDESMVDNKAMMSPQRRGRSAETEAAAAKRASSNRRQAPVKKEIRVKVKRSAIYHLLPHNLREYLPTANPNYQNYYGTVVQKTVGMKASYDITLDLFRGKCWQKH
jgi:hypothetical protein